MNIFPIHSIFLLVLLFTFCLAIVEKEINQDFEFQKPSRCVVSKNKDNIKCSFNKTVMSDQRDVWYQVPLGMPPKAGWPVALFFQGSFAAPSLDWDISKDEPFGAFRQIQVFKSLLDNGFAVVAPAADDDIAWETNFPPYDVEPNKWYQSSDCKFIEEIFEAGKNSTKFGVHFDNEHYFGFGISSGG